MSHFRRRKLTMSELYQNLSHSKWDCKYLVVFVPKYRRKGERSPSGAGRNGDRTSTKVDAIAFAKANGHEHWSRKQNEIALSQSFACLHKAQC
jgi:hypothetical protein